MAPRPRRSYSLFDFPPPASQQSKTYLTRGHLPRWIDPTQPPSARRPFSTILSHPFNSCVELLLPETLDALLFPAADSESQSDDEEAEADDSMEDVEDAKANGTAEAEAGAGAEAENGAVGGRTASDLRARSITEAKGPKHPPSPPSYHVAPSFNLSSLLRAPLLPAIRQDPSSVALLSPPHHLIAVSSAASLASEVHFTLNSGTLTLSLPKSVFESAGLQDGRPAARGIKRGSRARYIVKVDLAAPAMKSGKKGYGRLERALTKVEGLKEPRAALLRWEGEEGVEGTRLIGEGKEDEEENKNGSDGTAAATVTAPTPTPTPTLQTCSRTAKLHVHTRTVLMPNLRPPRRPPNQVAERVELGAASIDGDDEVAEAARVKRRKTIHHQEIETYRDDFTTWATHVQEWLAMIALGSERLDPGDRVDALLSRYDVAAVDELDVEGESDKGEEVAVRRRSKVVRRRWRGLIGEKWVRELLVWMEKGTGRARKRCQEDGEDGAAMAGNGVWWWAMTVYGFNEGIMSWTGKGQERNGSGEDCYTLFRVPDVDGAAEGREREGQVGEYIMWEVVSGGDTHS